MDTAMAFPGFVLHLKRAFDRHGYELYAVGGCVRDRLLGRPVTEYDLTTNARPEKIKELARETGPDSLYSVGEKFGTVGVIFGGVHVEITTYRGEWYEPGSRKPVVEFGTTLEEDLSRRDFTINAIAEEIDRPGLIDPFGGSADLHRRLVRAVGAPEERFRDDPLRLLRAVRFAASLGFEIERATATAIARCASQLANISRERVRDEMTRMLTGPAPDRALLLMADLGLLELVVPELLELREVATGGGRHKDIFAHTLAVVRGVPPDLVTRWAALLHDVAKPRTIGFVDGEVHFNGHERVGAEMARKILSGLRYDRQTIEAVAKVVGMHTHANSYSSQWTDGAVRRLVREAGDLLEPLLDLSSSDITSYHLHKRRAAAERVEELRSRIARIEEEASIQAMRPPLDGHDLMRMFGRPPGPWIRPIKDRLLELVLEGKLAPDDRETAERIARQLYGQETGQAESQAAQETP